jgi:hypothetical protein
MRGKRRRLALLAAAAGLLALAGTIPAFVSAADHLDAPGLTPPGGDTRLDINDVYAFQSPANSSNTVLVMTVNPLVGLLGNDGTFRSGAAYEFKIDSDGDAREDMTYRVEFGSPNASLVQSVRLKAMPAGGVSTVRATGSTGTNIPVAGGGTLRADVFDDPFFFDLVGFLNLDFCTDAINFFLGLNTSAIVLELPSSALGGEIGVWARTMLGDTQVDRMGRPAINTVFIPNNVFEPSGTEPSQRNAFNGAKPRNDQRTFRGEVEDTLDIFYDDVDTIDALAGILLPDILTINTSSTAGFEALNGRKLADDVIDIELGLVTNGAVTTDCVGNDSAFSSTFPYLAPAN